MHWNPASTIIDRLGGIAATAAISGASVSRVTRWRLAKSKGGTGGLIPQRCIIRILEHARATGIELTGDDFLVSPTPIAELEEEAAA